LGRCPLSGGVVLETISGLKRPADGADNRNQAEHGYRGKDQGSLPSGSIREIPWLEWGTFCLHAAYRSSGGAAMFTFLLWCVLLVLCWPVAILALVFYPIVWLLLLPFRIFGIALHGVLELLWAVAMFPARLLSAPFRV
jgi:hypothetical protein